VHQVAAKTGTTDNFVDNWTMGYTPNIVVGVWSGNADNSPLSNNSVGVTGAAPIWHSIIERASGKPCDPNAVDWDGVPCGAFNPSLYNFTQGAFTIPSGVHQASTSNYDGLKGGGNYDWMLDGEDPTIYGIASASPVTKGNGGDGGNGGGKGKPTH
jgi:membrane peptidoglycan carboxypeptidase